MGQPKYSASELAKAVDSAFENNPPVVGEDGEEIPKEEGQPSPEGEGAAPEAKAADQTPAQRALVLKHKGREIRVTEEEAIDLAQRGFDYERKMGALNQERQSQQRDQQLYENYVRYKRYLEENPTAAEAIGRVLETYEEKGRIPRIDFDGEGEEGTERVPPQIAKTLKVLQDKIDNMERQRGVDELTRSMLDAVESNPALKDYSERSLARGGKDEALQKLAQVMKTDPNLTVEEAAKVAATEVSLIAETLGVKSSSYAGAKRKDQARFGHQESGDGVPPASPMPGKRSFSGKDMQNGTVRRAIVDFLGRAE